MSSIDPSGRMASARGAGGGGAGLRTAVITPTRLLSPSTTAIAIRVHPASARKGAGVWIASRIGPWNVASTTTTGAARVTNARAPSVTTPRSARASPAVENCATYLTNACDRPRSNVAKYPESAKNSAQIANRFSPSTCSMNGVMSAQANRNVRRPPTENIALRAMVAPSRPPGAGDAGADSAPGASPGSLLKDAATGRGRASGDPPPRSLDRERHRQSGVAPPPFRVARRSRSWMAGGGARAVLWSRCFPACVARFPDAGSLSRVCGE